MLVADNLQITLYRYNTNMLREVCVSFIVFRIWFKTFKGDAVLGDIFSPSTAESSAIGVPAEAVGVDVAPVDDLVLVLHMCEIRILVFCL